MEGGEALVMTSRLDYGNISAKEKDFLSEDAANGLTDEEDAT